MRSRITMNPQGPQALLLIVFITLTLNPQLQAGKPKVETLQAWDEYVRLTEQRVEQELQSETGFFAHDSQAAETAKADEKTLASGGITVSEMNTKNPRGHRIDVRGDFSCS